VSWEERRLEEILRRQSEQLQEIICLLKLLVESQRAIDFPATAGISVKVTQ
jgi:hypothetical protein